MTFLDLFAGIGGFRRGLERSGHTPVGHVEIDPYANKSYMAMYDLKNCKYKKEWKDNSCMVCKKEVYEHCDGTKCKGEWYAKDIKKSEQERFQKLKSGLLDFLVPTLVSQEEWQDFMEREVDYFLQLLVCSKAQLPKISPNTLSLRMLNILCLAKEAEILPPFYLNYGKQGMIVNGKLSIPKILELPNTENECTLLDILEEGVEEKYYLSVEQTLRLLNKS